MYTNTDEQKVLNRRRRERVRELRKIILFCANWLALPLFAAFLIADYIYAREDFLLFACLRFLIVPSCILLNIKVRRTHRLLEMQGWGALHVFVCAMIITVMIFIAEGKTSIYYAGLNLLTIAVGSFIPWTTGALVFTIVLIYFPYIAWSFVTWSAGGHTVFLLNLFFMVTTIILTMVIRHFNETFRMAAIRSKVALHNELHRRAAIIEEKTAEAIHLEEQFRQSQKMEAVGRLAGGIAHDFNNLLMVIQSYAEILRESMPFSDRRREKTDQILKATSRATSLTKQMLAFGRKQILSPVVLDLNSVIDETAQMLKRLIGEDIDVRVLLAPSLWAVEADPSQIVQVVMNLCVNARDAMPRGGSLSITTGNVTPMEISRSGCTDAPPAEYVKLAIRDTGIGISKEMQEHIFEPFFTTKDVGKGTGLGLATVYGIVRQSGGYVSVESAPGKGTCFTVYLPRVERTAVTETLPVVEAQGGGDQTILVVEDEDAVREPLCDYLRGLGYNVLAASSGPQALALAEGHPDSIDLLVTDAIMPKMNGRELAERLTSQQPGLRTIFISGYTDDAVLWRGIKMRGATLLQKPFNLEALAKEVRTALTQS
jgi:signal transduction histidine kinase/CheY-like chemotaxis protein